MKNMFLEKFEKCFICIYSKKIIYVKTLVNILLQLVKAILFIRYCIICVQYMHSKYQEGKSLLFLKCRDIECKNTLKPSEAADIQHGNTPEY